MEMVPVALLSGVSFIGGLILRTAILEFAAGGEYPSIGDRHPGEIVARSGTKW